MYALFWAQDTLFYFFIFATGAPICSIFELQSVFFKEY